MDGRFACDLALHGRRRSKFNPITIEESFSLFGQEINCCRFDVITSNNAVIDWQAMNLSFFGSSYVPHQA
jgi:hypothetical protein